MLNLHRKLQSAIEKLFFKGKTTRASTYASYVAGCIILMVLVFFIVLNNIAYDWTGQLHTEGTGFRLDGVFGGLDGMIPFVPETVIFYVYLFYPLVILSMVYFTFVEYRWGYSLGWSLVVINAIAALVYIVFPVSTFWWRQELLATPLVGNFWANQVYNVFANDTSFNCFPSLHAAVSTIIAYTWYRYYQNKKSRLTKLATVTVIVLASGIVLSTLFIKQHYIADEIAGIALAYVIGNLIFNRFWSEKTKKILGKPK
jgi:membrane-associated phospholipid phosphatase